MIPPNCPHRCCVDCLYNSIGFSLNNCGKCRQQFVGDFAALRQALGFSVIQHENLGFEILSLIFLVSQLFAAVDNGDMNTLNQILQLNLIDVNTVGSNLGNLNLIL